MDDVNKSIGDTQITGLNAVKTLADGDGGAIPAGAMVAMVGVDPTGTAVRMRIGADPTLTRGRYLAPGDTIRLDGNLSAVRFLEVAPSATLYVDYLG